MSRRKLSSAKLEEVHLCSIAYSIAKSEYDACEQDIERVKLDLSKLESRKWALADTVDRAAEALERAKRGGARNSLR